MLCHRYGIIIGLFENVGVEKLCDDRLMTIMSQFPR